MSDVVSLAERYHTLKKQEFEEFMQSHPKFDTFLRQAQDDTKFAAWSAVAMSVKHVINFYDKGLWFDDPEIGPAVGGILNAAAKKTHRFYTAAALNGTRPSEIIVNRALRDVSFIRMAAAAASFVAAQDASDSA
jgi:hypothetical protein